MANQVDFKILPSDQFNVYSPQTRSEKVITYFTLLSKLRGDILAVSSQDDPNSIVSAYYTNVGNTQTLHLVKADGSEVTASNDYAGTVTSVGVSMPSAFTVTNSPITTSGTIQITGAGTTAQYVRGDGTLATFPDLTGFVPYVGATQNVDLGEYQIKAGQVAFDLTPTGTAGVGIMRWNDQDGTVDLGLIGGNVTLQIGQEQVVRVVNKSGINLTEAGYQAVKITGAQGNRLKVGLAQANNDANSADTIGLVTENIALNAEGFVTSSGLVRNIDTTGALQGETWADGDVIYLSPTTAGAVTKVKPTAPQHTVILGFVVRAHQTQGQIYVKVDNGYELEELHDVAPTPYVNNGVLYRDTATNLWKSATIPTVLGYTPANSTTTISTTAPLSGGGDLSANRTLSISQAGASTDGYLSSTDWNTFNNKASDAFKTIAVTGQSNIVADSPTDTLTFEAGSNIVITTDAANDKITINAIGGGSGSVTSVDMSVPTGFSISGNPITTSGTLALAFASGYSLPTNASQANWDTAYNNSITAFSYNTSTGVLTLTQQDAGTLTATVTLQPFTTDNLTQGSTNLYDKVVSLTGAGTTVVTGTYPNFTITSNDQHVGTVTSIATSAPITGGTITTSGTIGITQSGTAADGYLSSTDWNTFNSKVGGSGTINYVSKWTSTGAIGNSQIFDSGTYVGINTATPAAKLDISGAHVASIGLLRLNSSASNVAAQTYYIDGVYKAATYAGTDDNFYILGRDADIVFSTTSSTTTRMVITNGGNVGIGTSGPTQKLMVSGSIRVTGGYYDSSNSIGSNGQVLASTGSGTTWINASGGTVNGSGTVNYLSKWTGTTLLGDSLIYDNGTNVGVGTIAPGQKVDVVGAAATDTYLRVLGGAGTTKGGIIVGNNDSGKNYGSLFFDNANNNVYLYQQYSSGDLVLGTNTNEKMRITSGGNVGIGNTSPSQKLHVEGNIRVTGAYYDSANGAGSSGQVLSSTGSGTSWITPFSGSGTTNYVAKWTSGTALGNSQIFDNGTNVGIGTASPTETLDLRGVLRVSRSGVNDSGIIAFGNYVNGAGYYDNGIFRSALNAITTSGNTLHMGSYEALAFTTSANPLGSQSIRMYISGSNGNVGIGTTSPSRLLHVAGNAQVDGWLYQGGYYTGSVTIPGPSANYGNGRVYLRLCSSASGRIMTAKVRISSTWNWAPAFGSVEADISFYWTGSSLSNAYVNILSATGQAATNLTFGALEVEGGSISVPIYSVNTNPIYVYIQLSPDADPSQVSYSTWSSVAFPGQANVYIQTNLGVGTPSPAYRLDVNGTFHAGGDATFNGTNTYINSSYIYVGNNTADLVSISGNTVYLPGDGNVGIGNTAPTQKLHVTGNVRVTGAYYDSSNAAGTSGQILSSTGTGTAWISPGGGGGIITGSGTTNYVTKWTSGTAVGDSSIFDNGNVGIGTTSPLKKFVVTTGNNTNSSSNKSDALAYFGGGNDNPNAQNISFPNPSITDGSIPGMAWWSADVMFGRYKNEAFWSIKETHGGSLGSSQRDIIRSYFYDSGGYSYIDKTVIPSGNVGIGTTAPESLLHLSQASAGGDGAFLFIDNPASSTLGNTAGIRFATNAGASFSGYGSFIQAVNTNAGNGAESLTFGTWNGASRGERMRILDNGNVGIGTTSPLNKFAVIVRNVYGYYETSAPVAVFQGLNPTLLVANDNNTTDASSEIRLGNANSTYYSYSPYIRALQGGGIDSYRLEFGTSNFAAASTRMTISAAGNVGIGTTSPNAKLNVRGTEGSGSVSPQEDVLHVGGNELGGVGGYAGIRIGGASNTSYGAYIRGVKTTAYGNYWNTALTFSVTATNTETTVNEVMRITSAGNVGIGTTSPAGKLDVRAGSGGKIIFGSYDANYNVTIEGGDQLNFYNGASATTGYINYNGPGNILISRNLYVEGNSSGGTSGAVRITSAGNVGINETAPSQKLHVSGNIRVTGAYYDSANSAGTSGQILSSTGTGTAWIAAPSGGGVSGSGTTNYVTKWTSGSAVGNSVMYDNGTNVGIGTTSPTSLLQVQGTPPATSGSMINVRDSDANGSNTSFSGIFFNSSPGTDYSIGKLSSGPDGLFQIRNGNTGTGYLTINNSGNVGIGTTTPDAKLHVDGTVATNSALADVGAYRILKPNGGISSNTGWQTGAIKITYPVGYTYSMHRVKVNVYEYTTNESFTIYFGGYNYAASSEWYNEFAYILSNSGTDRNFTVRFGYDGSKMVVYIGELSSGWAYPQIFIEEVEIGYSGHSTTWRDGAWGIGFETSAFQNVTRTVSDTQATNWARNGSSTYYGFGNVGIGTTAPGYKLQVVGNNDILAVTSQTADTNLPTKTLAAFNGIYNSGGNGHNLYISSTGGTGSWEFNTTKTWGGFMSWGVSSNGTSITRHMSLTDSGNVGIGTTSPNKQLTFAQANDDAIQIRRLTTSQGNTSLGTGISWTWTSAGTDNETWAAIRVIMPGNGNTNMTFSTTPVGGGGSGLTERMRIADNGNVGIGTTSPSARLHVQAPTSSTEPSLFVQSGTSGVYGMIAAADAYHGLIMRGIPANQTNYSVTAQDSMSFFEYGGDFRFYTKGASFQLDAQINGGTGRFRGDVVAYYSFSDERLKDDIKPLEGSLDKVLAMQGVSYKWNSGERKGQSDIGLIAQQVEEVVPEVVREKTNIDGDTFKSVNYEHLVGVLIEAIKEQQKQIDELKAKLK